MKKTRFCLLPIIFTLLASCTENFEGDTYIDVKPPYSSTETFVFGNRIEIPYSIDNLRKAYESLDVKTKAEINIDELAPTHYYARFAPLDGEDLDILLNDNNLILYEFPMDVEILEFGTSYHDPTLPPDQPTYQYTIVDIDYWDCLINKIDFDYQILMAVFMPEDDDYYFETKSAIKTESAYNKLLKIAYQNAGQDLMPETKSSWTPSGYIKSYDNVVQTYIPIKKVRVRGKHLLKTVEALTDTNGYYVFPRSFNNTPTMMIVWESDDWDIREGTTGQAYLSKPCVFGQPWNVNVSATDGDGVKLAAIHRAAYRTFYGFHYYIAPPNYSRKIKIGFVDEIDDGTKSGAFHKTNLMGAGLDIEIASATDSTPYFTISETFNLTCHELGHAIQYTSTHASNYDISEDRMLESWAVFVQYVYTRREYAELGVEDSLVPNKSLHSGILFEEADRRFNYQKRYWTNDTTILNHFNTYTPILVDLFDDYNQLVYYDNILTMVHPNDNVIGFPPDIIKYYAFTSTSFSDLKAALIQYAYDYPTNPYGITVANINALFYVYYGF